MPNGRLILMLNNGTHGGFCRAVLFAIAALPAACAACADTIPVSGNDSAAVAAAVAKSRAGDTVLLPVGEVRITEAVTPKSGTNLAGQGEGKTILRSAVTKPSAIIDLSHCRDVRVSALTLEADNNLLTGPGIFARDASRLRIEHVTIRDVAKSGTPLGIHFVGDGGSKAHGVTDSTIADCTIENMAPDAEWGGGIRLSWGSSRNRILRNTIRNTGRGGIFADNGSTDLIIRGNTVSGSHGEGLGLEIWGDCDRCVLEDNRLDHWLSISGCVRCAARRNVIGDHSGEVKFIALEVIGCDEIITDNSIDGGAQIGISVSNNAPKDRILWGFDHVAHCVQWGAQLQGDKTGLSNQYFYRCLFANNGDAPGKPMYPGDAGHGFRINENARNVVWDACEFRDNRGLGVQVNGGDASPADNLRFERCRFVGNKRVAAAIWPGYTRLSWQGCVVKGNAGNALPPARGASSPSRRVRIDRPAVVRAGMAATFAARPVGTTAADVSYLWDLDDGVPGVASTITHVFAHPGRYRVTLLTWDKQGNATHDEQTIAVLPAAR